MKLYKITNDDVYENNLLEVFVKYLTNLKTFVNACSIIKFDHDNHFLTKYYIIEYSEINKKIYKTGIYYYNIKSCSYKYVSKKTQTKSILNIDQTLYFLSYSIKNDMFNKLTNLSEQSDHFEHSEEQEDHEEQEEEKEQQEDKEKDQEEDKEQDEKDKEELINLKYNLSIKKQEDRLQKERNEEKKRVYNNDILIYKKIKEQIKQKIINYNQIPELFIVKYNIFTVLENDNMIDNYDVFNELCEAYIKKTTILINKDYIPHNINYKTELNKEKKLEESHKELKEIELELKLEKEKELEESHKELKETHKELKEIELKLEKEKELEEDRIFNKLDNVLEIFD
jgi:hypothetical protein